MKKWAGKKKNIWQILLFY